MMYLLLIIGFVLLIKGADVFVEGASSIAKYFKVPSIIIGLTIVAMGTSAPEAAVSFTASLAGNSDLSLGNVIGSNIFNLLIVIGVCAVICPFVTHLDLLKRDMLWNGFATILLFLMILDGTLSRLEGLILVVFMMIYLIKVILHALHHRSEEEEVSQKPIKAFLFIVVGLFMVIFGGQCVVENASLIAKAWGMSETFIALTIVAIGTSLPELVTSVVAAKKGESGIALGNAVGSCLFNILFILGMSALVSPMHVVRELIVDTCLLIGVCLIIFIFSKSDLKTTRKEGFVCIVLYVLYSVFILMR